MDEQAAAKSKVRSEIRSCLASIKADDIHSGSTAVCRHIAAARELLGNVKTIGLYASIQREISLSALHDLLPDMTFAYPLCQSDKHLGFHIVGKMDQLVSNHYKIPEPVPGKHPEINPDRIDLVFFPGLAFGLDGSRLGRGQGYYDRTLEAYKGLKIGVALDMQIRESVPQGPHDTMMNHIVSPAGIVTTIPWKE